MKSWITWLLLLIVAIAAGAGGYWFGHRGAKEPAADESSKPEEKPVASVTVVPLRNGLIAQQTTVYGTVVAPPSEIHVISVPFECRVVRVLTMPGETVVAGQPLVEITASAATILSVHEATNAVTAAEHDQQLVKQRYDQKLATNSDLFASENALRIARGRLEALAQAGAGDQRQLKAEAAGIVSKVDVQPGQVIPIGGPLIELAAQDRVQVRLSVSPVHAPALKVGDPVQLSMVDGASSGPVEGTISLIGQRVDPATRLVDVTVSPAPKSQLLLDAFAEARLTISSARGLIVPRSAVLPAEGGEHELFTVKNGKAIVRKVEIGIENDEQTQVTGEDLHEGDPVIIVGNYELEDGMAVEAHEQAPSSQPAQDPQAPTTTHAPADSPETKPAETQGSSTQPSAGTGRGDLEASS